MPIYEYRCANCRKKTTVITLSIRQTVDVVCSHCGGRSLTKLVSRVVFGKSEESRLEGLADPSALAGLDDSDPRSVARWMKKMGREMGDEAGEDFDEDVDRAMEEAARGDEAGGAGDDSGGGEEDL